MMDIYKNDIKITYDKSIKASYLEIKNLSLNKDSYEYKIITEENINSLIKPIISYENNNEYFKYDITGLHSLEQYIKYNKLKKKDIVFIINSIDKLLNEIENYLISENSLYMDLKTIFIHKNNNSILFKYILIPNLNLDFSFEFSKFLIRLMRYVDIDDKDALMLSYELFVKSSKDNYSISDLLEIINKYNNNDMNENEFIDNIDDETIFDNYDDNTFENSIDYDKEIKSIYEKDISEIKNNYLKIDNTTNNILKNELFENFDRIEDSTEDEDLKFEKFKQKMRKKRKRHCNKSSINIMNILNWIIPIIIVLIPIIIYILFGKSLFYKNIIKIIIMEILLIGTYIINIVLDNIDCKQNA